MKKVLADVPFLATPPVASWPSRARNGVAPIPDYAPATGRRELDAADLDALRKALDELAASLRGGTIFKGLCSLLADAAGGRALTFAVVLRNGAERLVYEYAPSACAFVEGSASARESYLAGIECWATDFLAVLRGELGPIALTFGRARLWNALPDRFRFDLFGELYRMSHPLRRPAEVLRMYQREWGKVADGEPAIFPPVRANSRLSSPSTRRAVVRPRQRREPFRVRAQLFEARFRDRDVGLERRAVRVEPGLPRQSGPAPGG